MALWLQGAIDKIGCEGQGCHTCPYQIFMEKETWACVGEKYSDKYVIAIKLWFLVGQPKKGKRLMEIYDEMKENEDGVPVMNLSQIEEAVSLFSGLDKALYELTGNIDYRFDPDKIDWDLNKYSRLVDHWKNPDGTEVYTLVNSFTKAESMEYYLKGVLRVGKPIEFD